jgi:putative transposase
MPDFACLSSLSDCIELDFIEREATREPLMEFSIHLYAVELSILNTI